MSAGDPGRLNSASLTQLGADVIVPNYDRSAVVPSIVHIGVGGFFRAHQAVYLDDLLSRGAARGWGYCGVNMLSTDQYMRDGLVDQDCLYTLVERSAQGENARIVGSLAGSLHTDRDGTQAVLERLASHETRIVSLTITEGGYYVNEGTGEFNAEHPDIARDLANPQSPQCSFGVVARAQQLRMKRGLAPFTLMSCDNLQHNGDLLRRNLLAYAECVNADLAGWLSEHCAFPNSMVDRITPATTDEHRELVQTVLGIEDAVPVVAEPFMQWVLEDNFPLGRPDWDQAGVQLTSDVAPYEKMKMRLLNASHQAMCYIGMLLGYEFAHETMEDEHIRHLVSGMMDVEVTPLLTAPAGINLDEYKRTLIERFANPTIRDQLLRIGTEGSARIPGFVLPSIAERVEQGGSLRRLAFTVACWIRYLNGVDDAGNSMTVIDPHQQRLMDAARRGGRDPSSVLALEDIFDRQLSDSRAFTEELANALGCLYDKGARAALVQYAAA